MLAAAVGVNAQMKRNIGAIVGGQNRFRFIPQKNRSGRRFLSGIQLCVGEMKSASGISAGAAASVDGHTGEITIACAPRCWAPCQFKDSGKLAFNLPAFFRQKRPENFPFIALNLHDSKFFHTVGAAGAAFLFKLGGKIF